MPEVLWTICAILGVLVLAYLFTRYVAGVRHRIPKNMHRFTG